ncbi:hypothetical protein [Natronorubrum halophilum]|uniref:hypothetical protein n=1 Tax=Natronorubrum halophilum TaxID=1702106 RepID=UPI0013CE8A9C|nr:hypothetical protein [Natronorubrum halophilum]
MERRRFLSRTAVGATVSLPISPRSRASDVRGSVDGQFADSDVRVVYDPYDAVDWRTVTAHKCEFHNHVRGAVTEPAEVVDRYRELDYTVYAVADKGGRPIAWPWTAFSTIDGAFEDRNPEELGVVAFPGCEFAYDEHVSSLFSTLAHADVDGDEITDRWEQSHAIVDRTDHHVPADGGGLAVLAHPFFYYAWSDPDDAWERYRTDFEFRTREQGMVGLEVFNRTSILGHDLRLWDALLSVFAPDRLLWGFGVDDPTEYELGSDLDVNWTTVLLDDTEFDPTDQPASRRAAANAMIAGRTLLHGRETWDPDSEDPAPGPLVDALTVDRDAGAISIEASDYDDLGWVSDGEVVSTDETISLSADHVPYVRAHLLNDDGGVTSTQPIGLAEE